MGKGIQREPAAEAGRIVAELIGDKGVGEFVYRHDAKDNENSRHE